MLFMIFFLVCFGASVIGAICGIGGGVIIKPLLDMFGILDVVTISFLSGCTVLAMTTYSVLNSKISGQTQINAVQGLPLALGAAVGGLFGKWLFSLLTASSQDQNRVGAVQAFCLLLVTIGTLIYTLNKQKIRTLQVINRFICVLIGLILGIMSSFLGIGGGPINLVVLFYFFSMSTKEAAENSLYIIFFSQMASLLSTIFSGKVPQFSVSLLCCMAAGGIFGGICGRRINKKIKSEMVDRLFIGIMIVIICINLYNIFYFLGG